MYRFRSVWTLPASPADVYDALERLEDYPRWWPQVRHVTRLRDDAAKLVCRSALPYDLRFTTTQAVRDPVNRVLEASMAGDLEGFSRWTIAEDSQGTRATFEEQVLATKALLQRLDLIARPVFRANHAFMMHQGERGLRTYLEGVMRGRE
jgi:uncharacterized protein YndB with AHSA1/START domain